MAKVKKQRRDQRRAEGKDSSSELDSMDDNYHGRNADKEKSDDGEEMDSGREEGDGVEDEIMENGDDQ